MGNENGCSNCEKSFKTPAALKAHNTRTHKNAASDTKIESPVVATETPTMAVKPTTTTKSSVSDLSEIKFFGEVDMNKHGRIGSNLPAWLHIDNIEKLKRSIDESEVALKQRAIPADLIADKQEEIKRQRVRLDQIENSKPIMRPKDKDALNKLYESLSVEISDRMFTRTEMMKGYASANEEVRRMVNPSIKFDGDLAKQLNLPSFHKGEISRKDGEKAFKVIGGLLGRNGNSERLRKDRTTASGNFPGTTEVLC